MSTYVDFNVKCHCGHNGIIHLHEGDGPGKLWESYTLENLEGEPFYSESPVGISQMLKETNATCPKCKNPIQKKDVGDAFPA